MSKAKPALGSVDYAYQCEVVRWLDGRTVEVVVNVRPFGRNFQVKLFLAGIGEPDRETAEAFAPRGTKVKALLNGKEDKPGVFTAAVLVDGIDLASWLKE